MTTLILVRHGETDWNRDHRIQGATDIPLNDTGREQARAAARDLRSALGDDIPVVVSSDLQRAAETADIIAASLGTRVRRRYAGLRERSYGQAEGVSFADFLERWGNWHRAEIPEAEPLADLRRRAVDALQDVVRDVRRDHAPRATSVVAVAHGALIREVLGHATNGELPTEGHRLANGSAYTFLVERERLTLRDYAEFLPSVA